MSVIYGLDELDDEMKKELCKELTLIPVDPYVERMKKWGKGQSVQNIPAQIPILLFEVNKENRTVKFPFFTIKEKLQGIKPNRDRDFPKLKKKGLPKFCAELRDYQDQAAQEAFQQLKEHATTTLGFPPGWGKTILGAWLAGKCNGPTLVLTHRMEIAKAWVKTFELCFPQYAKSIWLVGENDFEQGVVIPKKCKNKKEDKNGNSNNCGKCENCLKEDIYVPCFVICMDKRIDKIPSFIKRSIVTLIIDEAHLFCTPDKVKPILATQPKFIIVETATLNRPDNMHTMMYKIAGEHCVKREPNKPFRLYKILTKIRVQTVQGKRGTDFNDFTQKLMSHELRNELIVECIKKNLHRKPMILTRLKNHVTIIKDLLIENDIEVATLFGSQKGYKDSHVLVGTIPKMGVGFDEANACSNFKGRESDLLILVTSIAQIELFQQVVGRIMRSKDPAIFYFIDDMPINKKHFKNVEQTILDSKGLIFEINPHDDDEMIIPDCEYNKKGECIVVETRNPSLKKKKIHKFIIQNEEQE
jgi:superfamily II DNA or RNA helicase